MPLCQDSCRPPPNKKSSMNSLLVRDDVKLTHLISGENERKEKGRKEKPWKAIKKTKKKITKKQKHAVQQAEKQIVNNPSSYKHKSGQDIKGRWLMGRNVWRQFSNTHK